MRLDVSISEFFTAPPEEVWLALTDKDALAGWLMPNDFAAEVGKTFTFEPDHETPWDGNVECKVLELVPNKKMVWSWQTRGMERPSRVEFELVPELGGTQLVFKQDGYAEEGISKGLKGGWPDRFKRLASSLPFRT